ncbi:MAG: penicillin-binding protein 2 [Alphaproteobacteria bacterium]|nr:penicillin-binding protein 2 [Alphaproteobacteria bacterium]
MINEGKSAKVFSRRAFIIGALQAGTLCILGSRLAWLQISQGSRYKTLSDKNRINIKVIAPSRGHIVDRFGVPLAVNNQNFRVLVIPEQVKDLKTSLKILQTYISIDEECIEHVLEMAGKVSKFVPIEVKDELTWEEVAKIEVHLPELPGLFIDIGEVRSYPYNDSTAHIVGYVGFPTKIDLTDDPVLKLPGFKLGKTGIEKKFDVDLRGIAGIAEIEVNVIGREIRELKRKDARSGKRIALTIDGELQRFAQQRLCKEVSASAVIMDAHTGAIYAMASHPSFDPNIFIHGLSASAWEELLADKGHPLTNKAIAGQYPPASTFKMVTALAGLQVGKITKDRKVFCPGFYDYGKDRFHCWKRGGHGSINIVDALTQSCDTYFYELATEIGIDKISKTAKQLGFGSKFGFELLEERSGLVPDKNWKMGYHGEIWRPGDTIVTGIGQGSLQATPMQLAVMTARFVNGGYAVRPWITGYEKDSRILTHKWPRMNINKSHLTLIKSGMDRVVNYEKGTAYKSRIELSSMAMGGKTGTAQVRKITAAQRLAGIKNEDLPWEQRHHGLFVGYAPVNAPRYVVSVIVEHGVGGSTSAAPIARDLLIEAQKRNPYKIKLSPKSVVGEKI